MPSFTLRFESEADLQKLDAAARAAGLSREAWAREVLLGAAASPVVRTRYALRGYSEMGTLFRISRYGDDQVEAGIFGASTGAAGADQQAYQRAEELVRRNGPGDRERAIGLLAREGFEVFETTV